jgi:hypothetical protein
MPKKRSSVRRKRVQGVEDWQLDHILTGDDPEPETFETIAWDRPKIHETWNRIKDSEFIQEWKAKHGLTFYEKEYMEDGSA